MFKINVILTFIKNTKDIDNLKIKSNLFDNYLAY